jgi:hypothetical protein
METRDPEARVVDAYRDKILPLRSRAQVRNEWLKQRLDSILPEIMKREGFDLWIVIAREYNEDPVIMTLLPEPAMSARRRTILVFGLNPDGSVDRLTLDRYGLDVGHEYYQPAWDPDQEEQYECLGRIVRERAPQVIGIDVSPTFSFGDGLTHSEYTHLAAAVGEEYVRRMRGAERLALGWLERRIQPELIVYPGIVEIGHALIAEAFSSRIIQPGITTTDDVAWWMRQKMLDLGLQAWFQPTVDIQAPGQSYEKPGASHQEKVARREQILPGDLLHCDVGFYYLGLATDQQQNAYVLRAGETDAPEGLKIALAEGNRLQDIHAEAMAVGRTGNEVLKAALEKAREEGLVPSIYTHPLGYHGHAAGPTIGLWDRQEGVPGMGDYELFDDTCYAIELNVIRPIPEWVGQEARMALEEDAVLTGGRLQWLCGRQTQLHLIG